MVLGCDDPSGRFGFAATLLVPFAAVALLIAIFGFRGNIPTFIELSEESAKGGVEWPASRNFEIWLSDISCVRRFIVGGVAVTGGPYFLLLTRAIGARARQERNRWPSDHTP